MLVKGAILRHNADKLLSEITIIYLCEFSSVNKTDKHLDLTYTGMDYQLAWNAELHTYQWFNAIKT